jgi:hypothetical protein
MTAAASDRPGESGLDLLRRWQESGATVWVYYGARGGVAGASLLARITEVSRCLEFRSPSTTLRLDIEGVRFGRGPLRALSTPSRLGRVAAISQKPEGLVSRDGVMITLDAGHSVFVCEAGDSGGGPPELPAGVAGWIDD